VNFGALGHVLEAGVAAWYEAKTLEEKKIVARRLKGIALDNASTPR
jgi:hypothetical protein